MKKQIQHSKTRFISGALLWAVLLYAGASCIIYWNDFTQQQADEPIVYHTQPDDNLHTVNISLDSLQKHIRVADDILYYLRTALRY